MDPFSAIGLAGNIITFVDFGFGLISTAKSIYNSKSGASADNEDLYSMAERLQQLTMELKGPRPIVSSQQDRRLYDVAIECEDVSVELSKFLDKLKAKDPRSKRHALKTALRNWWKNDQKSELEKRLDRCKEQLSLELLSSMKAELSKQLSKLDNYGQASKNELQSLARNIESLRQGSNVSCLTTDALDQIRALVQLSDDAILKVRQNRVLDALRFQSMNERFEDIEEAHLKTFDWILDDRTDNTPGTYDPIDNDDTRNYISDDITSTRESQTTLEEESNDDAHSSMNDDTGSLRGSQASLGGGPSDNSSSVWHIDDSLSVAESERSVVGLPRSLPAVRTLSSTIHSAEGIPREILQGMIEARDSFITWLENGTGVFYILGKPGSGKSTLMKYLVQHRKLKDHLGIWADGKKLVLGRFFFWKPGPPLQKNINGLVRGLLHCVLSECPDLIQLVFPEQWEGSTQRERLHIEHYESRLALERLIKTQTYGRHKFILFIDGLDEFEGHHADLARQLVKWTRETENIKLCISSREWPVFQDIFKGCLRIRLHELTWCDIQQFV
ncbi:hypothetical protein K445DRAFT_351197, partial [Daldinia sp. EC12]